MKKILITMLLMQVMFTMNAKPRDPGAGETNPVNVLGGPMPVLNGKLLDGGDFNADYFKGHVTIINFMYIGCPPCMTEIALFNKLYEEYKDNKKVQFLCIARQMPGQMREFNNGEGAFGTVRNAFGSQAIKYPIFAACTNTKSNSEISGEDIHLKAECNTIEHVYGVDAFPTTFYVDTKGIVRKITTGGPATSSDQGFYNEVKSNIEEILSQK